MSESQTTPILPSPEIIEKVASMLHDLMVPAPGAKKEDIDHPLSSCPKAYLYRDLARTICVVVMEWAATAKKDGRGFVRPK